MLEFLKKEREYLLGEKSYLDQEIRLLKELLPQIKKRDKISIDISDTRKKLKKLEEEILDLEETNDDEKKLNILIKERSTLRALKNKQEEEFKKVYDWLKNTENPFFKQWKTEVSQDINQRIENFKKELTQETVLVSSGLNLSSKIKEEIKQLTDQLHILKREIIDYSNLSIYEQQLKELKNQTESIKISRTQINNEIKNLENNLTKIKVEFINLDKKESPLNIQLKQKNEELQKINNLLSPWSEKNKLIEKINFLEKELKNNIDTENELFKKVQIIGKEAKTLEFEVKKTEEEQEKLKEKRNLKNEKLEKTKNSTWKRFLKTISCGLYNPTTKLENQLDTLNLKIKNNELLIKENNESIKKKDKERYRILDDERKPVGRNITAHQLHLTELKKELQQREKSYQKQNIIKEEIKRINEERKQISIQKEELNAKASKLKSQKEILQKLSTNKENELLALNKEIEKTSEKRKNLCKFKIQYDETIKLLETKTKKLNKLVKKETEDKKQKLDRLKTVQEKIEKQDEVKVIFTNQNSVTSKIRKCEARLQEVQQELENNNIFLSDSVNQSIQEDKKSLITEEEIQENRNPTLFPTDKQTQHESAFSF